MTRLCSVMIVIVGFIYQNIAEADVPDLIPVQGMITDSATGAPIHGIADIRFQIYNAEVDGTVLWSSLYDASTEQVIATNGFFTVYLGELDAYPLDFSVLLDSPELWLQITVNTELAGSRIRLATVPFAMQAQHCEQVGNFTPDRIQPKITTDCEANEFMQGIDEDNGTVTCANFDDAVSTYLASPIRKLKIWRGGEDEANMIFFVAANGTEYVYDLDDESTHNNGFIYLQEGSDGVDSRLLFNIDGTTGACTLLHSEDDDARRGIYFGTDSNTYTWEGSDELWTFILRREGVENRDVLNVWESHFILCL